MPNDTPTNGCPKTPRDAVLYLLRGYNEFPDEQRIALYLKVLRDCTAAEIVAAVEVWAHKPVDRAAFAGELREIITNTRGRPAAVQVFEEEWVKTQVTPEEKREMIKTLTPGGRAFLREALQGEDSALLDEMTVLDAIEDRIDREDAHAALEEALEQGTKSLSTLNEELSR